MTDSMTPELEDEDAKRQWLIDALAEGAKGDPIQFTPELSEQLLQSALRRAKAGERASDDVRP